MKKTTNNIENNYCLRKENNKNYFKNLKNK